MATANCESGERLGKLVALEGDGEIISTQLRLLPPSSKILIIPTILENLPQPAEDASFDARAFVRDVHMASGKRTAIARSFLSQSTSKHPRMVFMNGGSVSAQATCITKICEKVTNGEIAEAEAVFNDIIKDGVAGLMCKEDGEDNEIAPITSTGNYEKASVEDGEEADDDKKSAAVDGPVAHEEPTLKAMQAAESLDQETASLQPHNEIPMLGDYQAVALTEENVGQVPEHHEISSTTTEDIFTSPSGDTIVRSMITVSARRSILFGPRLTAPNDRISIISHPDFDEDDCIDELCSPGDCSMFSGASAPNTPHNVIFGEACIVDVHSATPEKKLRKVTSVDRFFPSNSRIRESTLGSRALRHALSSNYLSVKPSTFGGRRSSLSDYETMPRTMFMRASETTIRRSPTWGGGSVRSFRSTSPVPRFFVDRGTDAGQYIPAVGENKPESFEPVFSIGEDFVIHFTDGSENKIFDSVLRCYRDGSFPLSSSSSSVSNPSISGDGNEIESLNTTEIDNPGYSKCDEFDPYKPISPADSTFPSAAQRNWPSKHSLKQSSNNQTYEPPTPAMTPPPSANGTLQRYEEFVADSKSAIDVQNSLRSILKMHVPTSDGFSQHYHTIIPEADRLWKPVFRSENPAGNRGEGRTVDQILALGREDGVNADFFSEISGQVEKLGAKKSGASRSGTLDLRYLIANAIDAFVAHHVSSLDPMSDPALLATLVVPHLESYLATNSTRFLIVHYSSSQLPIILALQTILGSSLFRIAGILDSLSSDPPPFPFGGSRSPLNSPMRSKFSAQAQQVRSNSTAKRGPIFSGPKNSTNGTSVSFAKANYLLPSTATDPEITTFLSSIWKILIEKDNFYHPEPEPTSTSEPSTKVTIINTTTVPLPSAQSSKSNLPKTPPQTPSKTSYLSAPYHESTRLHHKRTTSRDSTSRPSRTSASKHPYASSVRSVRTTASERGRKDDARERQSERDWANFYIDEEDSEDDAYDRMVLGRAGVAPGKLQYGANRSAKAMAIMMENGKKRPANSKKALKWLGLA